MSVPYLIGFIVLFILQLIISCVFLKVEIPKPSKKSLALKMTCSTLFIINAILAMLAVDNFSNYAIFIVIGLCFSWIGDYLLHHMKQTENLYIAGMLCFLVGHIFYITAYIRVQNEYFPEAPFLNVFEVIIMIMGICLSQNVLNRHKAEYGKVFLPTTIYTNVIMVMLIKAISLSFRIILSGGAHAVGIALLLGAGLFTLSDFTLALLRYTKKYSQSYLARKINILTYFFAQMLLGLTILNFEV